MEKQLEVDIREFDTTTTLSAVSCGVPMWGARREEGAVIEQNMDGNLAQYPIEVAWW